MKPQSGRKVRKNCCNKSKKKKERKKPWKEHTYTRIHKRAISTPLLSLIPQQVQAVFPFPCQPPPPPPSLPRLSSLSPVGWRAHTHVRDCGCCLYYLRHRQRWLSSDIALDDSEMMWRPSTHPVQWSSQSKPTAVARKKSLPMNFRKYFLKIERETEKKDWMPGPKTKLTRNKTVMSRGQPRGDFLATWSLLDSPIWVHLTWRPQVGKRGTSWSTSVRWDSCVERESWSAADRCPEQSTCDGLLVCWVARCLSPI